MQYKCTSILRFGNPGIIASYVCTLLWLYGLHTVELSSRYNPACKSGSYAEYGCLIGEELLSRNSAFHDMLNRNANDHKTVILAVVDNSYVEMAINLLGYLHDKNIRNFLFICTDEESALKLKRYGIYPFLYENAHVYETLTPYWSPRRATW